jgi:hypothetical protein
LAADWTVLTGHVQGASLQKGYRSIFIIKSVVDTNLETKGHSWRAELYSSRGYYLNTSKVGNDGRR